MKGWDGVSVVSHSCVTSSNCKSKKAEVPSECINTWLREVGDFSAGASALPSLQKPTPSNCNSIWNTRTLSKVFFSGTRSFLGKHITFFTSNLQLHFISILVD